MTDWVRMRHNVTGGETLVTSRAVENYKRRGWVTQTEEKKTTLPVKPSPTAKPKPQPEPADETESANNESKEDA